MSLTCCTFCLFFKNKSFHCLSLRLKNVKFVLWIPWWRNVSPWGNEKEKKKTNLVAVQRRESLDSVKQTLRRFTQEHNGCCDAYSSLSIVRFSQPHPVLPTTCPLDYYWKKHRLDKWILNSFCFQIQPNSENFVWPKPRFPWWQDTCLHKTEVGNVKHVLQHSLFFSSHLHPKKVNISFFFSPFLHSIWIENVCF